jgi:pilus assembly protein CpaE
MKSGALSPQRPRIVLLMRHGDAHVPDSEAFKAADLDVHHEVTDIGTLAEDSPFFAMADALVIEVAPKHPAELEAFDRLVHLAADRLPIVAAVQGLTVADTRTLLKAGAVDVLPLPFTVEELQQAVEPVRRAARPAARSAGPARQGRIISVLGALGGVGATAMATQVGAMWAANSRVCLLDMDVQFGNAALYLDVRPPMTLGNLIEDEGRLDAELLQSVAIRHSSGLDIIASPSDMMPLDIISTDFAERLLRMATQAYDVVIVDLPRSWTEWTVRVLDRSDVACLVTNMSVPGIHQARRQLEILEANHLMDKLRIIANRVQYKMFGRIDLTETEAVLGRRIDHTIANDYPTVSAALDQGRTILDIRGKSGRVVKDVGSLVHALSTVIATEGAPRA